MKYMNFKGFDLRFGVHRCHFRHSIVPIISIGKHCHQLLYYLSAAWLGFGFSVEYIAKEEAKKAGC